MLVSATAGVTAGPLVALDGAQLIDILAHQILVRRLEGRAMEGLLDVFQRIVEIFLGGDFARAAGLRGEEQRLAAAVELLGLFFIQAGVRHGGGDVVTQA